jgi:thioredoxin-dependent peroxiredoxin
MKVIALVVVALLVAVPQFGLAQGVENFTLPAVGGDANDDDKSKFDLKDHPGKTIVLHFLLKTECPFCLRYTNEYAQLAATTPEVIHLFIKPDSEKEILAWVKQLPKSEGVAPPTIYRDAGAKLAQRFKIPDGYQFHGQSVHYPALVVLDGNGQEMFRHVGKSNSDRMKKDDFVKTLESMTGKQ